jgi:hypothetical protein
MISVELEALFVNLSHGIKELKPTLLLLKANELDVSVSNQN